LIGLFIPKDAWITIGGEEGIPVLESGIGYMASLMEAVGYKVGEIRFC
jgi:hypothetical protein